MVNDYDFEILGVTATSEDDGATPNLGDTSDGTGVAAEAPMFASLGFYGGPAPADTQGGSAGVVQMTLGDDRIGIAARDDRELQALANANFTIGSSDRVITSLNANAFAWLDATGADKVGLYSKTDADLHVELDATAKQVSAKAGGASLVLDKAAGTITAQTGDVTVEASPTSLAATYTDGAGNSGAVNVSAAGLTLSFTSTTPPGNCVIAFLPGGTIAITTTPSLGAPAGILVNLVPLVVP
jgi:hypothetical protein